MLSFQPKKADSCKLAKPIESYVRRHYDKGVWDAVKNFIAEVESRRNTALEAANCMPQQSLPAIEELALYYRCLLAMESRVPIGQTGINFGWQDALSRRKVSEANYVVEKAGILFNIASLYSRLATSTDISTPDGPKLALNYFQFSAGCLEQVRKLSSEIRQLNTIDISAEHLTMLIHIMLAQGYYSMYCKIDKASGNKNNVAKLAASISKHYSQAYELASREPLNRALSKEYIDTLFYQDMLFRAASTYWISYIDREQGAKVGQGFGKAVTRLRLANEQISEAMKVRGIRGEALETGRTLLESIRRELKATEQENLSVYMDSIPPATALDKVQELTMITPKYPPTVDLASPYPGAEVLQMLIPPAVNALLTEYRELLHLIILEENTRAGHVNKQIGEVLQTMNLPQKLYAVEGSEETIPEQTWLKVQQAQSSGGFTQIQNSMNSLKTLSESNIQMLNDLENMLKREEEEDKAMRTQYGAKWARAPSGASNSSLKNDIERYRSKAGEAAALDSNHETIFQTHKEILDLLNKSKAELDTLMPKIQTNSYATHPAVLRLKEVLENYYALQKRLTEELNALVGATEQDNIIGELMEVYSKQMQKEPVFQRELQKFAPFRETLNKSCEEILALRDAIAAANGEFDAALGSARSDPAKMRFLQSLEDAVAKFNELNNGLSQGHQFYQNLSRHLTVLHQKVSDFIYSRNVEKNDLLAAMTSQSKPAAYNPYAPPAQNVGYPSSFSEQQPGYNPYGQSQGYQYSNSPGSMSPGQYPPAQYPPAQYPPAQYAPGQYPPAQYAPGQYAPGQYPPGQYPPGQYQPGQYQPGQHPPGQYPGPPQWQFHNYK